MERVTGHGLELQGDGFARAIARVKAAGFPSVIAYVQSFPSASPLKLADELNRSDTDTDPLPIAADHLSTLWRREAITAGGSHFEFFLRRALVGEIHEYMPEGWPESSGYSFALVQPLVSWTAIIGYDLKPHANAVWFALVNAKPPRGWLPADANDERILAAFAHWNSSR